MKRVLLVVTLLLIALPVPALADDPTATPTLLPVPASPTSYNLYLRVTPTPFTIVVIPLNTPFNVAPSAGPLADTIINSYRAINFFHVIDFVLFILVAYALVTLLIRAIRENMRN